MKRLYGPAKINALTGCSQYNPIARSVVPELLPCLKEYNISFYGYNPIGGGLLSGKYKWEEDVIEGSRYDPKVRYPSIRRCWMQDHFVTVILFFF